MCCAVCVDDVADDAHARRGRVDVGVADHELFEDVVLDRPRELVLAHTLLLGGDDVTREHRQDRAVHRHRHRHLVERDAVEEDLHVLDGVDRDARLADVADDARMVAVVAAVRREIERDRQPHLPGREVLAVERVRLLGRRKARVLADRPRAIRVHRGARARGRTAPMPGSTTDRFERLEVGRGVERLDRDALGRLPRERVRGRRPSAPSPQGHAIDRCPVPSCGLVNHAHHPGRLIDDHRFHRAARAPRDGLEA